MLTPIKEKENILLKKSDSDSSGNITNTDRFKIDDKEE